MEITAAIFLGASKFPHIPSFSNPSFKNSKGDFEDYLRQASPSGLGVTSATALDLFDLAIDPGQQLKRISEFLDELKKGYPEAIRNLIIYYCGHGYQAGIGGREYFLALAQTDQSVYDMTGLRFASLSDVLKQKAKSFRYFYILDCCFAGQALQAFQGDSDAVGRLMTTPLRVEGPRMAAQVPRRGAAVLCATSPDDEARAPQGQRRTIFTDALVEVLAQGDKELRNAMTLSEVRDLTWEFIRERYKDTEENQIRPYLGSPDQTEGDIAAKVLLFPNPSSPRIRHNPQVRAHQERLNVQRQAELRRAEERQAAQRATEDGRRTSVQQPEVAPKKPASRPMPYGMYASIGIAIAAVALLVIARSQHAATAGAAGNPVQAVSGTEVSQSSGAVKPQMLAFAVGADAGTYEIGTQTVPAGQVISQLHGELGKQLRAEACFDLRDLGDIVGGSNVSQLDLLQHAARLGASKLLVVHIDSLSYTQNVQHRGYVDDFFSYSGDASLSYRILDVQTQKLVVRDSLSKVLPKVGPTKSLPVVSTVEMIDGVNKDLIPQMVPRILKQMGCDT